MQNILLIGGGGYVGSAMTQYFLKQGKRVTVLDEFVYQNQFAIAPFLGDSNYNIIRGDISDNGILRLASLEINVVVILAGLVGDPITKSYPEESNKINTKGIKNCIDYFNGSGIEKLIFISTCSNYGLIGENELANEDFELKPLSLYAEAKVDAEKYLLSKKGKVSYSATVLRFSTAFGLSPRMRFDLTVSEFTRDLFFGEELLVYDKHTWRPYCHVRDFARLIDLVINADTDTINFEVFNAGGDVNNFTKKMIIEAIQEQLPNSIVNYVENGSDPRNYKVSFEKAGKLLGFEPKFTVKHGIKELIDAMEIGLFNDSRDNRERYGNYKIYYTA